MKDKNGKQIAAGSWLVCINDVNNGELTQVVSECGGLALPACDSICCSMPLSGFATDEDGKLIGFIKVRDPNKRVGYVEAARIWKGLELQNAAKQTIVHSDDLTDEQTAILRALYGYEFYEEQDEAESPFMWVDSLAMLEAGIEPKPEWDEEYDSVAGEEILSLFIRDAKHYLVFAYGCKWDGSNGYKISERRLNAVRRSYDAIITPIVGTPSGKTLVCRESSHDVPMGGTTVIVALTDKEYETLNDSFFSTVEAFAFEKKASAMKYYK